MYIQCVFSSLPLILTKHVHFRAVVAEWSSVSINHQNQKSRSGVRIKVIWKHFYIIIFLFRECLDKSEFLILSKVTNLDFRNHQSQHPRRVRFMCGCVVAWFVHEACVSIRKRDIQSILMFVSAGIWGYVLIWPLMHRHIKT